MDKYHKYALHTTLRPVEQFLQQNSGCHRICSCEFIAWLWGLPSTSTEFPQVVPRDPGPTTKRSCHQHHVVTPSPFVSDYEMAIIAISTCQVRRPQVLLLRLQNDCTIHSKLPSLNKELFVVFAMLWEIHTMILEAWILLSIIFIAILVYPIVAHKLR